MNDNAASAFFEAAKLVLRARGEPNSISHFASIVGQNRTMVSRLLLGKNDPSCGKVIQWARAWQEKGYPPIDVRLTHQGTVGSVSAGQQP